MVVRTRLRLQPEWGSIRSCLQPWQGLIHRRPCVSIHSLSRKNRLSIHRLVIKIDVIVASALGVTTKVAEVHGGIGAGGNIAALFLSVDVEEGRVATSDIQSLDNALVL